MRPYRVRVLPLVTTMLASGCATAGNVGPSNAQFQTRQGVLSLVREDFEAARASLVWVASRCEAGEQGPRAMLLLAAAELDPGNPEGSPTAAATLAESYLRLPSIPSDGRVLARTVYRVAAELGGRTSPRGEDAVAYPPLASQFETCDTPIPDDEGGRPLPSLPYETMAAHVEALESLLAARGDSLQALRGGTETLRNRIAELEAEIQRITELLTNGAARQVSHRTP